MFDQQEKFWNEASAHLTLLQTTAAQKTIAQKAATPTALTDKMWAAGMGMVHGTGGTAADLALREAWKYGAYRGATGTLSFFVNDVPFNPGDIPMNSSTWIDVLCGVCVGCQRAHAG